MTIDATAGATAPAQTTATPPATNTTTGTTGNASTQTDNNTKISGPAAVAASRQQLNVAIVQSALTVSLSSKSDPLTVVYKSAIANLNEQLKPTMGDNAIQNAASQDNSPAGTAGRIVSLSTGLFQLYKQSFPGEDESTVLDRFMKVIQGGIDTGFSEARGVLSGMGVLGKPAGPPSADGTTIGDNIDATYKLVTQGLADFMAATKAKIAAESAATGQADGTTATTGNSTDTTTTATS
ncbi:MAG TPA: DUF5610 domain-containing protein [Herbaspirillum sp.]|jgi:hypothetical protein